MHIANHGHLYASALTTIPHLYQGTSEDMYFEDYWVRVDNFVFKGSCRETLIHRCNVGFTIGTGVDVRFEKHDMFLKLSNGKEQKVSIEKKIEVNSETESALSPAKDGLLKMAPQQPIAAGSVIERPSSGNVNISSIPDNAEIVVDGAFVGNSPASLRLAAGKHLITARLDGFNLWSRELSVLPDSDLKLIATLEKNSVSVTPSGTEPVATIPATGAGVPVSSTAIPKAWMFPGHPDQVVNFEIRDEALYEDSEFTNSKGNKITTDCVMKRLGDRWVGKCTKRLLISNGGQSNEQCSLVLDEVVTSMTPSQISGESQEILPRKKGESCPTAAKSMVKFVNVPWK